MPRTTTTRRVLAAGAAAFSATMILAGCGGGDIESTAPSASTKCDPVSLAVNPWVGMEASVAVVKYVAEKNLAAPSRSRT